jgi:hypothetical protein
MTAPWIAIPRSIYVAPEMHAHRRNELGLESTYRTRITVWLTARIESRFLWVLPIADIPQLRQWVETGI